jgi:hypothetical protein
MSQLHGLPIIVSPDRPKYVLPEWLVPGLVPWPPGFRAEINAWSTDFLGTWNMVPDGKVVSGMAFGHAMVMSPRTYAALRQEVAKP